MSGLAGLAIDFGADFLGNLLRRRGKKGGVGSDIADAAVKSIAKKLGVEANDAVIQDTIRQNPEMGGRILREVNTDYGKMAEAASAATRSYHRVLISDNDSASHLTRLWRPFCGYLFGLEVASIIFAVVYTIIQGNSDVLINLQPLWAFLGSVLGTHAGVVGVYVWRRSEEKMVGAA